MRGQMDRNSHGLVGDAESQFRDGGSRAKETLRRPFGLVAPGLGAQRQKRWHEQTWITPGTGASAPNGQVTPIAVLSPYNDAFVNFM